MSLNLYSLLLTAAVLIAQTHTAPSPSAAAAVTKFGVAKKVLFVMTNSDRMGPGLTHPTGNYLPEFAHPYNVISPHHEIVFSSLNGGRTPIDPMSLDEFKDDAECNAFLANPVAMHAINNTVRLDQITASEFALVLYPGGHGPMMDLTDSNMSHAVAREVYEQGGFVSAVCHGVGAVVNLRMSNGELLIKGKRVTGFSNAEEEAAGLVDMVPYLLEDKLIENGGLYEKASQLWESKVSVAGRLITGQNPNSSTDLGHILLTLLTYSRK